MKIDALIDESIDFDQKMKMLRFCGQVKSVNDVIASEVQIDVIQLPALIRHPLLSTGTSLGFVTLDFRSDDTRDRTPPTWSYRLT